jgi:nucleoside-diphosphate-sugar epimerase
MASTVLILGAAGRIGQVLAHAFAEAGWQVRAQARKPLPAALAGHPRVQAVCCDALDRAALRRAADGAQVVVHALNPPYTEWDRLSLPLVDAALDAARHGNALLMLPGNVYNFGRELPALLTLDTPERGDTPKARIRIETEARLAAAAPEVRSVVIRAGDFFGGAGTGSWFDQGLVSRLKDGRFVYPAGLDQPHAWAYLPDLAQAFVRVAGRHAELNGHRRLHFSGHTLTGREMLQACEQAAGRPLRATGLPWPLMRLAAWFVPMVREMVAMRYLWQRSHRLDGAALGAFVGELPQTPTAAALRQALSDLDLLPQPAASALSTSARA